jgi:hypothetical protein
LLSTRGSATQETEIRRIKVPEEPRKVVPKTPSQPTGGHGDTHLSSQAMREAEIGRIEVAVIQPWKKSL